MALAAVLSELILVGVCMTVEACCKPDACKCLEFYIALYCNRMALDAFNTFMHSRQREAGSGMVEPADWLKGVGIVAFSAIGGKCLLVVISMAGRTPGVQPKVGELLIFN